MTLVTKRRALLAVLFSMLVAFVYLSLFVLPFRNGSPWVIHVQNDVRSMHYSALQLNAMRPVPLEMDFVVSEYNAFFNGRDKVAVIVDAFDRRDPWGTPYVCISKEETRNVLHFYSCGPDRITETNGNDEDDISSWNIVARNFKKVELPLEFANDD